MLAAALLLAVSFDVTSVVADQRVLTVMQEIARLGAADRFQEREVAAYLVRDENGTISAVIWPHSATRRAEHYEGPIPGRTVAIAHTHPLAFERPSRGDVEQAKRLG